MDYSLADVGQGQRSKVTRYIMNLVSKIFQVCVGQIWITIGRVGAWEETRDIHQIFTKLVSIGGAVV